MTSIARNGFVLLLISTTCLAGLNLPNAASRITSRPLQKLTTNSKDFIQIASENGFRVEQHQVTTDDGYILTMFRMPPGDQCIKKTPVLLMHGLLQSAECFLDAGREAPGFVLAQQCYDVWFGNARGNHHSRKHVELNPDEDLKYWKFSIDEMGLYDVPAMIDCVLTATDTESLIYVGFSQGAGSFIIMNSERPEYADKTSLFVGLAPATRHKHTKSVGYRLLAKTLNGLQAPLEAAGVWEVLSQGMPIQGALSTLCQVELLAFVCGLAVTVIDSFHPDSITPEIQRRIFENAPAGTSIQNLAWYGQSMNSSKFVKFDYGSERNSEVYGNPEPPEYDFKAVKTPTVIFHGSSDHLVDWRDADWAARRLPNVLEYVKVHDPLWSHLDMTYSRYWRSTIFVKMNKYLNKYSNI